MQIKWNNFTIKRFERLSIINLKLFTINWFYEFYSLITLINKSIIDWVALVEIIIYYFEMKSIKKRGEEKGICYRFSCVFGNETKRAAVMLWITILIANSLNCCCALLLIIVVVVKIFLQNSFSTDLNFETELNWTRCPAKQLYTNTTVLRESLLSL